MEHAVLLWLRQARQDKIAVNGCLVKAKALKFAQEFGVVDFKASNGWLDKFKTRNKLGWRTISGNFRLCISVSQPFLVLDTLNLFFLGEANSADAEVAEDWIQEVSPALFRFYHPSNIFNLDEFALFYKAAPNKTLEFKGQTCADGKFSKLRLSVLAGANMDGTEKTPLLVIGKSLKPRCFKGVRSLPAKYAANKRAWMTSILFSEELTAWDKKLQEEEREILVIVDNCPSHPKDLSSQLVNINLVFLPPNVTSLIQPMDAGIIRSIKEKYRKVKEVMDFLIASLMIR